MQGPVNQPEGAKGNRAAYLVVLAGICAAMHIWKLPPALPELQKEVGLSLVDSGFLLSLVQMAGMLLGLLVGLFAEKIGLRRCVLMGLSLLGVASALGTIFDSRVALFLFRAVEGCGVLMVTMPAPGLVRRLVAPAHLSRVLGVWGSYMPIGTVIILLFGSWVLSTADWQALWWLMAGLTFLMLVAVAVWVPPDDAPQAAMPRENKHEDTSWAMVKTTLASRKVWLIALCFGVYSGQWTAVIGFLPSIYVAGGISGTTAGVMTAIVGGANAIGNLGAGYFLHRRVPVRTLLYTGFAFMAAGAFIAFALDVSATVKFIAVFLFSAVGGLIPTTLFLLCIRFAPSVRTTSTSVGWMQQCSAFGQFVGPPIVAWIATLTGGWQWTWVATGACAAVGIVIATRLAKAI